MLKIVDHLCMFIDLIQLFDIRVDQYYTWKLDKVNQISYEEYQELAHPTPTQKSSSHSHVFLPDLE